MKLKNNIFVRWGGANSVRQKGEKNKSISYHYPPDSRGIYAFPIKAIELFLSAHRLKEHYSKIRFEKQLWHHLGERVKNFEIIERSGSWVLTEFIVWERAFNKELLQMKLSSWEGHLNKNAESINIVKSYWLYYMRTFKSQDKYSKDPIELDRYNRSEKRESPTKQDLNDKDFVNMSLNGDDKRWFPTYAEYKKDNKGNTFGNYSKDHLEVFLPNVK